MSAGQTTTVPSVMEGMRFDVLDALRGVCAVVVVLYHFQSSGLISNLPLVRNGWLFVDYFFVLSGFVIAHSYGGRIADRTVGVGRFMALRMGRIYPLHIAVLLGIIALEMLLIFGGDTIARYVSREPFTGSRDLAALVQNIFLLQSFGIPGGAGWNTPAWSIAAEMWTYLLFALVFLVKGRAMLIVTSLLAVTGLVFCVSTNDDLHITFNGGFLRCVFGFASGVLTYHAFRRWGAIGGTPWELAGLFFTVLYVCFAEGVLTFAAPFVFSAMIFVLASQRGIVSRVLEMGPFQFLGLLSYSIYMIHNFLHARLSEVLQVTGIVEISVNDVGVTRLEASPLMSDALTIAMLALLVFASWISYNLIEKPGRNLSRKLFGAPRQAPKPDTALEAAQ